MFCFRYSNPLVQEEAAGGMLVRQHALLFAGIVAEENPYDKLQLTATIPSSDPLFQQKRALLQRHNLATQQSFDLYADKVCLSQQMCRS